MMRLIKTVKHWQEVDGAFISAAVTFYASLALFPLLLFLVSLFGWLLSGLQSMQDWQQRILQMIADETSERIAAIVSSQLEQIQANANVSGSISLITLIAFTLALFVSLEKAFRKIWQIPKEVTGIKQSLLQFLFRRLLATLMLGLIILTVLLNFLLNMSLDLIAKWVPDRFMLGNSWWLAQVAASIVLNALLFSALFQMIPRAKVLWRHAIHGGVLTAMLWEPGSYVLATFVISERYNAFGVVGAFLAILLWIFYGTMTILFGATLVCIIGRESAPSEERDSHPA